MRRFVAAIPAKDRKLFPEVHRRLWEQARKGRRPDDELKVKARGRNVKAIRSSLGQQARYHGKRYPSIRAAQEQTGVSRKTLRDFVI